MSLVRFVLKHPYTVAAMLILVCLLGVGAGAAHADRYLPGNQYSGRQRGLDLQRHECHGHPESHSVAARAPDGFAGGRHLAHRSHQL
jgi:hypothetical protein